MEVKSLSTLEIALSTIESVDIIGIRHCLQDVDKETLTRYLQEEQTRFLNWKNNKAALIDDVALLLYLSENKTYRTLLKEISERNENSTVKTTSNTHKMKYCCPVKVGKDILCVRKPSNIGGLLFKLKKQAPLFCQRLGRRLFYWGMRIIRGRGKEGILAGN